MNDFVEALKRLSVKRGRRSAALNRFHALTLPRFHVLNEP